MKKGKNRVGVIYSTNPDYQYETTDSDDIIETPPPSKQKLVVRIDRHARGGKQVTLVQGFVGTPEDLSELSKMIKNKCGVGGSAKDGEIIIQGDFREKVIAILEEKGYNAKRGN